MQPTSKILFFWIHGIVLSSVIQASLGLWILMLVIFSSFFFWIHYTQRNFYLENFILACVLLCTVQVFERDFGYDNTISNLQDGNYEVLLKIKERSKKTNRTYSYVADLQAIFSDSTNVINMDCLLFQKKDSLSSHFYPGDLLYANVYMKAIPKPKHPALFDSHEYWRLKGISNYLWLKGRPIKKLDGSKSWYDQIRCKQAYWLELLNRQNLSKSTRQILSALLLGDRRGVGGDLRSRFSNLGLAHVLALSGLHISLIYGFFVYILGFIFQYRPTLQSICLVVIIVLYALLTGMSPSVMRASLMFMLYAVSLLLNRSVSSLNIVMISAFFMLIYNANLLYDLGFQLSYLAVFGILYFYRFFKNYFEKSTPCKRFVLGIVFVTISAQLSTGVLSVYYFHSFPISFLWSNLLVLPMITLLLYFGFVYLFLLVLGIYTSYITSAMDTIVELLLRLLSFIDSFSFSPFFIYMTRNEMFYFYGLLLLFCLVFLEKKFKLLRFLYLYVLWGVCFYYSTNDAVTKELFINASKNALTISIVANNEQVLLTDDVNSLGYLLGDYAMMNSVACTDTLSLKSRYKNEFVGVFDSQMSLFDRKLIILENQKIRSDSWANVDVLILRSYRDDIQRIKDCFSPEVVLLDAKIPAHYRFRMKQMCLLQDVQIVDLNEEVYTISF